MVRMKSKFPPICRWSDVSDGVHGLEDCKPQNHGGCQQGDVALQELADVHHSYPVHQSRRPTVANVS
jgi:hypothetical protein